MVVRVWDLSDQEGEFEMRAGMAGVKFVRALAEHLGAVRNLLKYSEDLSDRDHEVVEAIRQNLLDALSEEGVADLVWEYGPSSSEHVRIPGGEG